MPNMFISYRREDSKGIAGRIRDRLAQEFGERSIFMDVDSIPPGVDFAAHIETTLTRTKLLLLVIGPRWLEGSRLRDERDFIRMEIEGAMRSRVAIWPLLVEGAVMPERDQLPASIQFICDLQAYAIVSGSDFHSQIERVIRNIRSVFGGRIRGVAKAYLALFATMAFLLFGAYAAYEYTHRSGWSALHACREESALRSRPGPSDPVYVKFRNVGAAPLKLYWLDPEGRRLYRDAVAPGTTAYHTTYETHPFVITDWADQCRMIYVARPDQTEIEIK